MPTQQCKSKTRVRYCVRFRVRVAWDQGVVPRPPTPGAKRRRWITADCHLMFGIFVKIDGTTYVNVVVS
jgi:hypothetical protein